jgi:hypothetical protein
MYLSKKGLAIVGASLYICEGTKARVDRRRNSKLFAIELTNKDPRIIIVFLRFLREIIKAEETRVKAQLFIYPDHDKKKLEMYWSNLTKIPINRFNKTIKLRQKNLKYKPNPLGTLKIRYYHKGHFLKIQGIINEIFGV